MVTDVTVLFVNMPQQPVLQQQIHDRLAALAVGCHARIFYHVRIEARHRHHALGALYYIDIVRETPDDQRKCRVAHAVHSELSTAVTTALDLLIGDMARRARASAAHAAESVDGHIVRISRPEGNGVFATSAGVQISFNRDDVEDNGFDRLCMGDRVWWMPGSGGRGRLLCMSRSKRDMPIQSDRS